MVKVQRMLKILVCLGMVAAFTGCASDTTTKHESAGQYVDDSVITTKVKAELAKDPIAKATQISVETYQGTVQLSGFVDSLASVKRAGEIARSVEGVKNVKNNLVVK